MVTPWVRFAPERAMNRKLRKAGFAARGLDEAACCQVAADDSDGHISEDTVEMLAIAHGEKRWRKLVDTLVAVGRWEPAPGGWLIHDYAEFNQTKAHWEAHRAAKAEAGRRGGQARGRALVRPPDQASALALAQADASALDPPGVTPTALASAEALPQAASLRSVSNSSSSISGDTHDRPGDRPAAAAGVSDPDDNHVPDLLTVALGKIADRRVAQRMAGRNPLENPAGFRRWLLEDPRGLRDELRGRIADWYGDHGHEVHWTPQTLADHLDPPVIVPRNPMIPKDFDRPPCDVEDCDHGWIRVEDADGNDGVLPCPACMPLAARAG